MKKRLAEGRQRTEKGEEGEIMQGKGLLESDMDVDTFDELNQRLDDFEQKQTQNQASL